MPCPFTNDTLLEAMVELAARNCEFPTEPGDGQNTQGEKAFQYALCRIINELGESKGSPGAPAFKAYMEVNYPAGLMENMNRLEIDIIVDHVDGKFTIELKYVCPVGERPAPSDPPAFWYDTQKDCLKIMEIMREGVMETGYECDPTHITLDEFCNGVQPDPERCLGQISKEKVTDGAVIALSNFQRYWNMPNAAVQHWAMNFTFYEDDNPQNLLPFCPSIRRNEDSINLTTNKAYCQNRWSMFFQRTFEFAWHDYITINDRQFRYVCLTPTDTHNVRPEGLLNPLLTIPFENEDTKVEAMQAKQSFRDEIQNGAEVRDEGGGINNGPGQAGAELKEAVLPRAPSMREECIKAALQEIHDALSDVWPSFYKAAIVPEQDRCLKVIRGNLGFEIAVNENSCNLIFHIRGPLRDQIRDRLLGANVPQELNIETRDNETGWLYRRTVTNFGWDRFDDDLTGNLVEALMTFRNDILGFTPLMIALRDQEIELSIAWPEV